MSVNDPSTLPKGPGAMAQQAVDNWVRYQYVRDRGHFEYCEKAQRLEQYYLGGGEQWLPEDRAILESQGRRPIEINEIFDAINNALGYQVANRVDISFRPRGGGATEELASTLSKLAMQIADSTKLQWHESQVFSDGMIQQRGYYEVRLAFDKNMQGTIDISVLDPMDVIPDPDGKEYDPDTWSDVTITRWYSLDQIESFYGSDARRAVEDRWAGDPQQDFGDDINETQRNTFAANDETGPRYDAFYNDGGIPRYRIIDRQFWQIVPTTVVVFPTGDVRNAEDASPEKLAYWRAKGASILKRPQKRVRWVVTTSDSILFDDWSPYDHFTVVPFFPYFRRGKTRGGIDNLVGPQDLINKGMSQYLHVINTTANGGWIVEQNSLTNMTTEDLKDNGATTGLVIEHRKGAEKPAKIEPNPIPSGLENIIQMGSSKIKAISGSSDERNGTAGGANQAGIAVQAKQFAAQMSLTVPLDNLGRTRHMLAQRLLELIQGYYDEPRVFRITKTGADGQQTTEELAINQVNEDDGSVLNDVTVGEYDVVIAEQPAQITYENSQFNQAMEMRKQGIQVPDDVVLRYSALADKAEVIKRMNDAPKGNPLDDAKAVLAQAQAEVAKATAVSKNVEAMFSGIRTAQIIAQMPQSAPIADTIVRSAGFVDKDGGDVYGNPPPAGALPPAPNNTHPATPDNPDRGLDAGIENGNPQPVAGA